MGGIKLLTTSSEEYTSIRTTNDLTYVMVMESVSNEETKRIWDAMTDISGGLNYLWWSKRKIGIIFQVDTEPDYDALQEYVQKDVHCPYVVLSHFDNTGEDEDLTPVSVREQLRTGVYVTKEKNVIVGVSSSLIFSGPFEKRPSYQR